MSWSRLVRIVVAVGLTAFLLYISHPLDVARAAAGADLRWIGMAVGLVLVDRTLMALRWIDLLSALTPGSRPRFSIVLRIFFVSSFVSNFVPSVAADMYRAYALSRYKVHLAESTASVLMDRILGVLSVVLVGAGALPFAHGIAAQRELIAALAAVFGVCAVAIAVVFSEQAAFWLRTSAGLIPIRIVRHAADALTDAVRRYAMHHREMARVLALSIVVQLIRVLQAWCLGRALGIQLPFAAYCVFIPVIVLIMQLPITVNGIGTTQAGFLWLFAPQGVPAAPVFALSVLFLALGIVGTLPGGLLYAADEGLGRRSGVSREGRPGTRGVRGK